MAVSVPTHGKGSITRSTRVTRARPALGSAMWTVRVTAGIRNRPEAREGAGQRLLAGIFLSLGDRELILIRNLTYNMIEY